MIGRTRIRLIALLIEYFRLRFRTCAPRRSGTTSGGVEGDHVHDDWRARITALRLITCVDIEHHGCEIVDSPVGEGLICE